MICRDFFETFFLCSTRVMLGVLPVIFPGQAKPIKWSAAAPECAQLSTAPLTTPMTPNLRTKRRAAMNAVPREAPMA